MWGVVMWERQLLTPEMGNVVQAGTMFRYASEKYNLKVAVVVDSDWNRLVVLMQSGDYEYQSDYLDVHPLLGQPATALHIREALELFRVLVSSHSSRQKSTLTPLELTTALYTSLEPVLA